MTVVRLKGLKRYRSKGGWYTYHRKSGRRVNADFGTPAFLAELAAIEGRHREFSPTPGTVGALLSAYRASPYFSDLAPATRAGYGRMMDLMRPVDAMPLPELTSQFVAGLRDRISAKHGRRQANYVLAVLSVACENGKEHGLLTQNPVMGVKRLRRSRQAEVANRPWTQAERQLVLRTCPDQIRIPIALAMFTGLRKSDVLALMRSAIRDGRLWRKTSKTGQEISIPLHPDLVAILAAAACPDAVTIATTSRGKPWTVSGFNSTFIKFIAGLKRTGQVDPGLTFHGLRHTCGTLLVEAGYDIDSVRRWLGQRTLSMAIHYTETADTSDKLRAMMGGFDPLGTKR
jgi:integrase